ncbi:MoaD/ThiS family protein [Micromonospora sp. LH3U1]|uniref:MoaD/ThiS family protein n=1 Tax=Micromonospora sp. LH3U1 TaxID=3018339 RepID=UPI00234A08DE|nr:MoaD/ThiS family protein [Micromonospora sp. LH3U1]WCN79544.1 MoaD/ThiS family protein [Micromonospora sp. LH3U1]
MPVEVHIPTMLRGCTGGARTVEGSGGTLADLLGDLEARYAGVRDRMVTETGALRRLVLVYVNDHDVRGLGGLQATIRDGDTVTISPALAGGAMGLAAAAALNGLWAMETMAHEKD